MASAPLAPLVEALRAATPEERRRVRDGLTLLRRLLDESAAREGPPPVFRDAR